MRQRLYRFMQGRYGMDNLGKFLIWFSLVLIIVMSFVPIRVLSLIPLAAYGWEVFRMFSRNIYKRSYENSKYLNLKNKAIGFFRGIKQHSDKNTIDPYKIFKCPSCGQKLRVPKGKGRIQISCRRCGTSFIKRT